VRDVELSERQSDFVAIARATHGIELVHASSPRLATLPRPRIKKQSAAFARPRDDVEMKKANACAATFE
jgi:hypothetical protein